MNDSERTGSILHGSLEGVEVLRFVGEVRHTLGPALERYLERLLATRPQGLVIDLSETEIIDSTCLGQLARTALRMRGLGLGKASILSPRADIREVLRSMSFDQLFHIVGDMAPETPTLQPLEVQHGHGAAGLLSTMLDAHQALMSLSEQNRMQFKDVVEALERETNRDDVSSVGRVAR